MLSNNQSFRKLHILGHKKRSKVEPAPLPNGNVSLDDLAFLVKRLSVQIDDLETWKEETNQKKTGSIILHQEEPQQQPLSAPLPQSNHTKTHSVKRPPSHTVVDPWASYVPQNYGALLQRLEDIESLQKCPNECCASTGTVSSADGVPWPQPIEPFQTSSSFMGSSRHSMSDMLDTQYAHWCTLMRCLPLMDPVTSAHVKTVGLYAMREILKSKANQKREMDHHIQSQADYLHNDSIPLGSSITTTKLRDSMSYLGEKASRTNNVITTATQDMPAWMSTSETKTAIDEAASGALSPPTLTINTLPVPSKGTETTTTPTPSGFPSPMLTGRRFHRWVKYKKMQRKTNTDTATTPMAQSQTLRKIGSWFF